MNAKQLMRDHGPFCGYCHVGLVPGDPRGKRWPTVEHVIPQSKGGGDDRDNLLVACIRCNTQKYNRTPVEWLRWLLATGRDIPPGLPAQIVDVDANGGEPSGNPWALLRTSDGLVHGFGECLERWLDELEALFVSQPPTSDRTDG